MSVPVAPNIAAPITDAGKGAKHQIVKAPGSFRYTPSDQVIYLVDAVLPGGTVGAAYTTTVQAHGGTSPYTYSRTSGSLPAGLNLNASTGVISGTPTTAGSSTFTVQATDSAAHTASQSFTITVSVASSGGGNWGYVA